MEFVSLLPALPFLSRAPRGDGHPVLVMPGWLAGDGSTRALRWFLRDRGYHTHAWRLGLNRGPTAEVDRRDDRAPAALHARHGRKVSVVGWSLGGIYARELARRFPELVRQVITLASPFRDAKRDSVQRLYRHGPHPPTANPDAEARYNVACARPSASRAALYSKTDGIVAWRSCIEEPGPNRENIAIRASHCGIGHHPPPSWSSPTAWPSRGYMAALLASASPTGSWASAECTPAGRPGPSLTNVGRERSDRPILASKPRGRRRVAQKG